MVLKELVVPSLETLIANYRSNRLLLIHPSSRFRTLLIASLLESPPCPLYYYSLGMTDVSLSQFLTGLANNLDDQAPTFGTHINHARQEDREDLDRLAEALARDLDALDADDYLLILDEYDRADGVPEIEAFIELLLSKLPEQCHILVNSRSLPRLPWVALVAKHQAVVLKDAQLLTSGFYSGSMTENPNVEVFALGPGYVIVDGEHVSTWEGHLPRLLFFFALDRPMVTRADICQAFWPDLPIDQAVNVFHVTKRRLHKALGFDVLVHESGQYRVNPKLNLQYDVLEFVGHLVEGRSTSGDEAAEHWQHAIHLYRGEYLQGHDDPWIKSRRGDFREGYVEALTQLAYAREEQGQDEVALGLLLRGSSEIPNREDIHREVLRLYDKLGRHAEAAEHYQRLVETLEDSYGVEPSPETQDLYGSIVNQS